MKTGCDVADLVRGRLGSFSNEEFEPSIGEARDSIRRALRDEKRKRKRLVKRHLPDLARGRLGDEEVSSRYRSAEDR
ncbi:MAG TPA: hypothetical protein VFW41_11790, partial [Gaiellaceae bacterium]|nr:hypothetical protein [Gaiellaceae bacterium]